MSREMQEGAHLDREEDKPRVPEPPSGWQRLVWLGPGFLWMVSAAGSGELLFTPRVGALYGYALLWALIIAVILKWFINREIGRFSVCTGVPILQGFKLLPGPANWAVWLILIPQLLVAVATIAGLAGSAATALTLMLPIDIQPLMVVSVLASTALVLWGRYTGVERVATILAVALALAASAAAIAVFPQPGQLAAGLVPQLPTGVDFGEVLPWLGFMLSGAAGMIWYSYWIQAKGYGAAAMVRQENKAIDPSELGKEDQDRLRGWLDQMTIDNSVAVIGALLIALAFLVLGTELLLPRGLVPEEQRVAEVLGVLLGAVFGPIGFWFMILGVFIGFWDTVLSDQDGFGRMFADGTRILLIRFGVRGQLANESFLMKAYVVILVTALPIILFLTMGEPVELLKLAGAIEAAHIPVVTGLTLYLNLQFLPRDLQPTQPVVAATALAGLFFMAFAIIFIVQLAMPTA